MKNVKAIWLCTVACMGVSSAWAGQDTKQKSSDRMASAVMDAIRKQRAAKEASAKSHSDGVSENRKSGEKKEGDAAKKKGIAVKPGDKENSRISEAVKQQAARGERGITVPATKTPTTAKKPDFDPDYGSFYDDETGELVEGREVADDHKIPGNVFKDEEPVRKNASKGQRNKPDIASMSDEEFDAYAVAQQKKADKAARRKSNNIASMNDEELEAYVDNVGKKRADRAARRQAQEKEDIDYSELGQEDEPNQVSEVSEAVRQQAARGERSLSFQVTGAPTANVKVATPTSNKKMSDDELRVKFGDAALAKRQQREAKRAEGNKAQFENVLTGDPTSVDPELADQEMTRQNTTPAMVRQATQPAAFLPGGKGDHTESASSAKDGEEKINAIQNAMGKLAHELEGLRQNIQEGKADPKVAATASAVKAGLPTAKEIATEVVKLLDGGDNMMNRTNSHRVVEPNAIRD